MVIKLTIIREKKIKSIKAAIFLFALCICMTMLFAGCRKQKIIPVFTYEKQEDGSIVITGLTDKGKADSKITVPSVLDGGNVTLVASEAFRDSPYLREVIIEEGIAGIAENVFLNCTSLESITFPESLKEIGTHAVTNTKWEKDIFEKSDEIIINDILVEVKSDVASYMIPDGVTCIASGAFYGNKELKEVRFNDKLQKIGNYAFSGCTGITGIKLPSGVKIIGYGAFSGCTQLEITVDSSVEQIATEAFLDVERLIYEGNLEGSPWGAKNLDNGG